MGVADQDSHQPASPISEMTQSQSVEFMNETFTSWELYDLSEAREEIEYAVASDSGNSE
jgi:hypothetical protein